MGLVDYKDKCYHTCVNDYCKLMWMLILKGFNLENKDYLSRLGCLINDPDQSYLRF